MNKNENEQNYSIYLKEIAQWFDGKLSEDGILAEVPILQRGLVWNQSQIELLWDSILRGIPIGSLVLCKISEEIKKQSKSENASHFILDGQQRCNAIKLGFSDFPNQDSIDSIVWLDLDTDIKSSNSTREFLIRLTTLAHPWGFNKSDEAGKLDVNSIRQGIEKNKKIKDSEHLDFANYERFNPSQIYPFYAKVPIPLSLLLKSSGNNFWENVKSNLTMFIDQKLNWAKEAVEFIDSDKIDKGKIECAIQRVINTKIIALNVPNVLLESTNSENSSSDIKEGITNIEHLFQRLNRQGTILDGEELSYSMMKSYFPEIAKTIDDVAEKKMPASKLLQQSIRVALSDDTELKRKLNVSQIRRLVSSPDKKDKDDKEKVISFINDELKSVADTVEKWLTNDNKTWGLPHVLRTGIVMSSPDVYCLLLYLARKYRDLGEETYKKLIGIALFIHWFVVDDKWYVVSSIFKDIYNADNETILSKLVESTKKEDRDYIKILQDPDLIEKIIDFDKVPLDGWKWDNCKNNYLKMKENGNNKEEINDEYDNYIFPLVMKLVHNRDLLLYAQRNYLRARFNNYDPARKDLWEQINRPWDFDHILPAVFVRGKLKSLKYKIFCDNWVSSNGNLRAWPFEANRSDQAIKTKDKMEQEEYWENSFINENERDGYSDETVISDREKALEFAKTCKSRIIRIYKEWYDNFKINELLDI